MSTPLPVPQSDVRDRAGRKYWDQTWKRSKSDELFDPRSAGIVNFVSRQFDRFFRATFASFNLTGPEVRLLEVGCAQSFWLPYFRRQFGFTIFGIDYSEVGCVSARHILSQQEVDGQVLCADLFAPPEQLRGSFDVVNSNGLVEHFDDTRACVEALARFLKPDGILVTTIPNMTGAVGFLQKYFDRRVFDVHVPLDREALAMAHREAGLEVVQCDYFLFANSGVVNAAGSGKGGLRDVATKTAMRALLAASIVTWFADGERGRLPRNRFTSPYVVCVARKRP